MRESCSSGSVGGEGGNRLAYPAYTGYGDHAAGQAAFGPQRWFAAVPQSFRSWR